MTMAMGRKSGGKVGAVQVMLEAMDFAFDGKGWQGPTLCSILRGVTPGMAMKVVPGRKTIWEQVLHAAYWKQRVLNKLVGMERFPRKGSNWPRVPTRGTAAAWRADLELLHDIHRRLRAAVARLDDDRLDRVTRKRVLGVAAHDVYHVGQISMLRKMLAKRRRD
jgi:hypothetical protein